MVTTGEEVVLDRSNRSREMAQQLLLANSRDHFAVSLRDCVHRECQPRLAVIRSVDVSRGANEILALAK